MNTDNRGSNLVFFLIGAATGAAIALLYAPQEGRATRQMISEKASEVKDRAAEITSNAASTAKDKIGAASNRLQGMAQRVQDRVQDGVGAVGVSDV